MLEGILLFIFGTAIGSFLNVLIDRLSHDESILGRSHCDYCKKTLEARDLIPVVSFLIAKARCRYCKKNLSWYYPFVELLTGIVFVFVWFNMPWEFFLAVYPNLNSAIDSIALLPLFLIKLCTLGVVSCIIVMFFADLKYFIIPDGVQIGFAYFALILFFIGEVDLQQLVYRLGCAIIVMLPMLCIYLFTKGRGLGFGDVKLAANIGLFMGIVYAFAALYISFILGAVIGVGMILLRKGKMKTKIPFGPFILLGVLAVMFMFPQVKQFVYFYYGI